jgi:hypothetical protein
MIIHAERVAFQKETYAVGRNGNSRQIGLQVEEYPKNMLEINPVNSKGELTNCAIHIPKEDLPSVINALKKFL